MAAKKKVVFLQLPQTDNDTGAAHENIFLAAFYLRWAAEQAGEGRHFEFLIPSRAEHQLALPSLAKRLAELCPDVLVGTLYLWNIESTLRLVRLARDRLPRLRIALGGPETAKHHPFLFRQALADAIAIGEGEGVFPAILRTFRGGPPPDFQNIAWRTGRSYCWGRHRPPRRPLAEVLPPPENEGWAPDENGVAYLEASRGCPMRCAYCRYGRLLGPVSRLPVAQVLSHTRVLANRGARLIRFIDPTFNQRANFDELLAGLREINRNRRMRFFAEINAESITARQAALLSEAGFLELEVGMQSRDPTVLRAIQRPTDLPRLAQGIRRLSAHRIRVTLDVMYGLPRQKVRDVRTSIRWALRKRNVRVQCLQTLLLPGTPLRARRRTMGLHADNRPPYAVHATPSMTTEDMRAIEQFLATHPRLNPDCPTRRFVGRQLPDLFAERVLLRWPDEWQNGPIPGRHIRRALFLRGENFYASRSQLARLVRQAIRQEPDTLWQFVLQPATEEPLDVLDTLIEEIRRHPLHLLDRYGAARLTNRVASRRVFVKARNRFSRDWIAAAEETLAAAFF